MEKVYARTKGIRDDMVSGFCPGCMHSTVIKLIGEVLEEMHLLDKAACAVGVGCCGLHMDYITYDYFLAAHGRACAVATGAKRSNPESLVFTYQGDGDLATTAPNGRDPKEHGYPMHVCEILNQLTAPYYLERTSCNNPANVNKTKAAIKKAFQNQLDGKGFSLVEIVTSCPTNWGMEALEALDFLEDKMFAEFPLGVIRDKSKEGA